MQNVWLATPSAHQYKIVDVTGQPEHALGMKSTELEPMAHAPNGSGAIVAAVTLANAKQRRIVGMCRINMDILFVID